MAMKTINVNPLNSKSINKAIAELEEYKSMLKNFPQMYTQALTEFFIETLAVEHPKMTKYWIWDFRENDGKAEGVVIFDGIVQFVEFGTGLIGEMLHDGINPEWLSRLPSPYNVGYQSKKGEAGHYMDKQGRDYWVYQKDGRFWSTYGQKANPFIYRSVEQLLEKRREIGQIILEGMKW